MISKIVLENFKGHSFTSINLNNRNITVLVGKNGTGKTSILQSLHYFSMLAYTNCDVIFLSGTERSPENLVKRGAAQSAIYVTGNWDRKNWTASIKFSHNSSVLGWMPTLSSQINTEPCKIKNENWKISFADEDEDFKKAIQHTVYLKLAAEKLAEPSVPKNISPKVEYDGYGLASAIANLKNAYPEQFDILEDSVKNLLPFVKRIRIQKKEIERLEQRIITVEGKNVTYDAAQKLFADELVLDLQGAESLPAHNLSEGTLLILGLLTVLVSSKRPNLILLDDIEQGLHPIAQRDLIRLIIDLTKKPEYQNLQIVLTTHSPFIIDEVEPADIWLLDDSPDGKIYISPMSSYPNVIRALDVLTTGELWSSIGEEWVGKILHE